MSLGMLKIFEDKKFDLIAAVLLAVIVVGSITGLFYNSLFYFVATLYCALLAVVKVFKYKDNNEGLMGVFIAFAIFIQPLFRVGFRGSFGLIWAYLVLIGGIVLFVFEFKKK